MTKTKTTPKSAKKTQTAKKAATKPQTAKAAAKTEKPVNAGNAKSSKKVQFIALLDSKGGRDVNSLSQALGWLPHTVRAGLTRLKKAGYRIEKTKAGNPPRTHYRITAKPEAGHAKG